jgi:D-alanyl-D-alanine carboxypeptidase/D-alanyl-D-alanine-endopeptidase (penicillin-binding protein 4)
MSTHKRDERCSVGTLKSLNLVAVALAVGMTACAARATPGGGAAVSVNREPAALLQRDLDALFTAPAVDHTQWGVSFYSIRQAKTLYALNASRFLVPASNQKLLTAAAAAEQLGWDFRFTTRLLATAHIDEDGSIDGDVIVTSNGDPTINPRHAERWRAFDDWAAALRHKGLRIIRGRLIGDDNLFAEPGWGVGWAWDNLQYGYGAPPSALQYNENQVEVLVGPGMAPGVPAIIGTSPAGSGLVVENAVRTIATGETLIDIARVPGSPHLIVRGQIAGSTRPVSVLASVGDPTRFYLNGLRYALGRHGIDIAGGIADMDDLEAPVGSEDAIELVVDASPPLSEIVDVAMKWSRNIYAETLLLATAAPGEPATGTRGLQSMRETLKAWGILPEQYLPRDGSGLSRYDYVSADALTMVLRHALADPRHAEPFQATLPVAGESGTLAGRMKSTPAAGRVRAKTGTLSNVRALSGYLTTLDGDTVVFSMLANNFSVSAAEIDAIMDAALNRIVQLQP